MIDTKSVTSIRDNVNEGLAALDELQSKTQDQNFHSAISDNRSRFKEIKMDLIPKLESESMSFADKVGWLRLTEFMLGVENKKLDDLKKGYRDYGPDVVFKY